MDIKILLRRLKAYGAKTHAPIDDLMRIRQNDPFKTLIATILSAQSQDKVTWPVCENLFYNHGTPQTLVSLSVDELTEALYPITYYKTKAKNILNATKMILEQFNGKVPQTMEELTMLPGVGPKTASVVIGECFGKPAMIVDTHVHRISNRFGIVDTIKREETVAALKTLLPPKEQVNYSNNVIKLGQTLCTWRNPKCDVCPLNNICPKKGVK